MKSQTTTTANQANGDLDNAPAQAMLFALQVSFVWQRRVEIVIAGASDAFRIKR